MDLSKKINYENRKRIEVILLSRNTSDTGLRIRNSIELVKNRKEETTTEMDIVTTMPKESGGGPSRVDYYTEPRDAGLLEVADVSSPRVQDDGEGSRGVSMQLMGC